VHVE
jgi:hypothetical protein